MEREGYLIKVLQEATEGAYTWCDTCQQIVLDQAPVSGSFWTNPVKGVSRAHCLTSYKRN